MIESVIRDNVVVTRIPEGTSIEDRALALGRARHLAKGASTKGQKYKRNWAEYNNKKRLETLKLL